MDDSEKKQVLQALGETVKKVGWVIAALASGDPALETEAAEDAADAHGALTEVLGILSVQAGVLRAGAGEERESC